MIIVQAIREIKLLKALNHENIVHLKEIVTFDVAVDIDIPPEAGLIQGDIFMAFEFCDFDLSGLLRSPKVVSNYSFPFINIHRGFKTTLWHHLLP